ncbi:MAG: GNAT family N-acetyltransferase [Rhodospirillaceae bacterium]
MMIPRLETERLILREFRESDIDDMAAIFADEEVPRFITQNGLPQDREYAWRVMTNLAGHWALRGFGMWALEDKAGGRVVGYSGPYFPETWPDREIGWTIGREHWGKGYASEAARRALGYARDALRWPRVIHVIDPANTRSIAVAERLGSKRVGA